MDRDEAIRAASKLAELLTALGYRALGAYVRNVVVYRPTQTPSNHLMNKFDAKDELDGEFTRRVFNTFERNGWSDPVKAITEARAAWAETAQS